MGPPERYPSPSTVWRRLRRWERDPRMYGAFVHVALMFITLGILARVVGL